MLIHVCVCIKDQLVLAATRRKKTWAGNLVATQVRSKIGNPPDQRNTLRSLGLKRIGDVVVKEDRPEIRGMVYAVRHLIAVEEVE
jgi:large subunit ribosomal protein L30